MWSTYPENQCVNNQIVGKLRSQWNMKTYVKAPKHFQSSPCSNSIITFITSHHTYQDRKPEPRSTMRDLISPRSVIWIRIKAINQNTIVNSKVPWTNKREEKEKESGKEEGDLDTIDGKETAEDTLLETGAENNNLVLFIHGWFRKFRRANAREREIDERREMSLGDRRGRSSREISDQFY